MSGRPTLDTFFPGLIKEQNEDEVKFVVKHGRNGRDGRDGVAGEKGERGEKGEKGEIGPKGDKGDKGERGERGFPGEQGERGLDGIPGLNGLDGKDATFTPKELIEKINKSKSKIAKSRVEGLEDIDNRAASTEKRLQNFLSLGGSHNTILKDSAGNILRGVDTLQFLNGTLSPVGDGHEAQFTAPSGGGGSGYQAKTSGVVDGSNATFTWATAPNAIVVDQGRVMQKVSSDGTVNWTGTTSTVLTIAPTFDIFAVA